MYISTKDFPDSLIWKKSSSPFASSCTRRPPSLYWGRWGQLVTALVITHVPLPCFSWISEGWIGWKELHQRLLVGIKPFPDRTGAVKSDSVPNYHVKSGLTSPLIRTMLIVHNIMHSMIYPLNSCVGANGKMYTAKKMQSALTGVSSLNENCVYQMTFHVLHNVL